MNMTVTWTPYTDTEATESVQCRCKNACIPGFTH